MATTINFPDTPSVDDEYTYQSLTYKYNGVAWFPKVTSSIILTTDKILVGNVSNIAAEEDFLIGYDRVDDELKTKATVTATVDLSANGIGEITLSANTSFAFTNYKLNKEYLLQITANGFTPSFAITARHIIMAGSAVFGTTGIFYVSLRCIDITTSAEKLQTMIGVEV